MNSQLASCADALYQLIEHVGSQRELAALLNVSQPSVSKWFRTGIPVKRAIQIERKTKGLFTREMLCPDIFNIK